MRPFIPQMVACLGLLQLVAVSGCGGSRERIQDASVEPEPEPEPEPPAEVDAGAAADASPTPGPADVPPDTGTGAVSSADGSASPPSIDAPPLSPDSVPSTDPDAEPTPDAAPEPEPPAGPPQTCGGVTCPALFALVDPCRPMGTCSLDFLTSVPPSSCYANGIKVVGESILPPTLVGLVKRADGSDCYRARVTQTAGSMGSTVVWETPAGELVASGVFDGAGNGAITCDGATTALLDPTCVAVPAPQACPPGVCP